jgi:hypothetical protein
MDGQKLKMFWFKPKKIFHIEWSYECNETLYYTEYVKAKTWYDAWQKVKCQHDFPIWARKIEEVK